MIDLLVTTLLLLDGRAVAGEYGASILAPLGGGVAHDSGVVRVEGGESMMAMATEEPQLSCKDYYPVLNLKNQMLSIFTKGTGGD